MKRRHLPHIFLSALLLCCSRTPSGKSKPQEQWAGVWIGDQKIGWVYTLKTARADGYELTERTKLDLSVMGQDKSIETLTQSNHWNDHRTRDFRFALLSKDHSFKVEGIVDGSQLTIEVITAGERTTESIHVPEGVYMPGAIGSVTAQKHLQTGDVVRLPVYDPSVLRLLDVEVEKGEPDRLMLPEFRGETITLKVRMLNVESVLWVDDSGWTVKQQAPMGIEIVRTTRENAMRREPGELLLEILTHYSIPSRVEILNPRRLKRMVVELTGLNDLLEIEDERQSILSDNPLRLEVTTRRQAGGNWQPDDIQPTILIQCDNDAIRKKALSITQGARGDSLKVELLIDWMNQNISKSPTISLPSALDVLESREGDCNEHAVLFAALARAVQIPTRVCVGVVYQSRAFYYHAWNKVWLDGWVACDPTFGQFPADATHIKLLEGDLSDQLRVAGIIGRLGVDVIEYSETLD